MRGGAWQVEVPIHGPCAQRSRHHAQKFKTRSMTFETSDMPFLVRRAAPTDAGAIAWHRARMFQDMGEVSGEMFDSFRAQSERWTKRALESGEYVGWLGISKSAPDIIIAGAGVQLRQVAPHPRRVAGGEVAIAEGRHGMIINVFTEPEWRGRGLATLLMQNILVWARTEQLDRLLLHASTLGRSLYERLGFVETNEMRYEGDLSISGSKPERPV